MTGDERVSEVVEEIVDRYAWFKKNRLPTQLQQPMGHPEAAPLCSQVKKDNSRQAITRGQLQDRFPALKRHGRSV
jgi:hypothetical protein